MHYFIDGYNMLFRLMHVKKTLQVQREQIIKDLNEKASLLRLDFTVVFDAAFYTESNPTRGHFNALEIIFTSAGETADEYILNEIQHMRTPKEHTVVTSDKQLARRIRYCSAHTKSVEEFIRWLNRIYQAKIRDNSKVSFSTISSKTLRENHPSPTSFHTLPEKSSINDMEYYTQIFEVRWQNFLEEENKKPLSSSTPSSSRQKRQKNKHIYQIEEGIYSAELVDKSKNDMERWLKIFERFVDEQ
jgi:predicted RNA-binding protein with PIN domain